MVIQKRRNQLTFAAICATKALRPICTVLDEQWLAALVFAKWLAVNAAANIGLVLYNDKVCDVLLREGLLEIDVSNEEDLGGSNPAQEI